MVGLVANPDKPACRAAVQRAAALIAASGRQVVVEKETAELARLRLEVLPDAPHVARRADLLLVFGGDGTMLRVAREVAGLPTPILGINVGGLGFLTAVSSQRLGPALAKVWTGDFRLERRPLITATGQGCGQSIRQAALNDFVITRGPVSRLIEVVVSVDGQLLTRYRGDGLIVSSPTGSTAYSLSAGGAIVSPDAEVFTLTPICPHTLSNRSVVVNLASAVQVKVISPHVETILTADGQVQYTLASGDAVTICRSRRTIHLLRLAGSSFFETLRRKLNWSGTNVGKDRQKAGSDASSLA